MPYQSEFSPISQESDWFTRAHKLIRLGSYQEVSHLLYFCVSPQDREEHRGYYSFLEGLLFFVLGDMKKSYEAHDLAQTIFQSQANVEWLAKNAASWFRIPFGSGNIAECERLLHIVQQYEGVDTSTDVRGLLHQGLLTTLRGNIQLGLKSITIAQKLAENSHLTGEYALCSVYKCLLGMHANDSRLALESAEEAQNKFRGDAAYTYYDTFSKIIWSESLLLRANEEAVPFYKRKSYMEKVEKILESSEPEVMSSNFLKGIWYRQKAEWFAQISGEPTQITQSCSFSELAGAREIPYNRHAFKRLDHLTSEKSLRVQPIYWQNQEATEAIYSFLEDFSATEINFEGETHSESNLSQILLQIMKKCLKADRVEIVEDASSKGLSLQYLRDMETSNHPLSSAQTIDFICIRVNETRALHIHGVKRSELSEKDLLVLIKAIGRLLSLAEKNSEYQRSLRNAHEEAMKNQALVATARISANLIHDLRAPLGTFERLLLMDDSELSSMRGAVRKSVNRLYAMVDALRHGESENIIRKTITRLDFSFGYESLWPRAKERNILFTVPKSLDIPVSIDATHLERAWMNLASNAVEFAASEVQILFHRQGSDLILQVIDDGPGVPDHFLPRLFERGATLGKAGGTGLGLAYVKQVLLGHGGDVHYFRRQEKTIFECLIPYAFDSDIKPREDSLIENRPRPASAPKKVAICLEPHELSESIRESLSRMNSKAYTFIGERHKAQVVVSNQETVMLEVLERDDQEYLSVAPWKLQRESILHILTKKFELTP